MVEHIASRSRNADKLDVLEEHIHGSSCVYPTLAAGVSVLSGAVWTLGNFVELIPANTIVKDFDIHWMVTESTTDDEVYELVFYNATTEISRVRFATASAVGANLTNSPLSTLMPIQPKNSQIQVKLASSGEAETAVISVIYHTY